MAKRVLLAVAWIFAAINIGSLLQALRETPPSDFMIFYFAGKLAASGQIGQLYHRASYQPLLAELHARGEYISPLSDSINAYYFVRPAFAAFFYVPFAGLPYRTASLLAVLGNVALLSLLVWKLPTWFPFPDFFGPGLFRVCLVLFSPFAAALGHGQDALLLTLLAAYGIHLALDGRQIPAGILLASCAFKPHLILALPAALLARERRRTLYSFSAALLVLVALSFAFVGPHGVREWVELVRAPSTDFLPERMGNVRALGLHFGGATAAGAALLTLIGLGMILRWGSPRDQFSAAILVSLLLGPHTYRYDLSLLAVVAVLADHAAFRYVLLLPWLAFYPRLDLLPMVFLSLGYLVVLAARAARNGRPQHNDSPISRAGAQGAPPVRSSICG